MIVDLSSLGTMRQHAVELLSTLGVSRIIVVDDEYATTVEELIAQCGQLGNAASQVPHLQHIDFGVPENIWTDRVRAAWSDLDTEQREESLVFARASSSTGGTTPDQPQGDVGGGIDVGAARSLEDLLASMSDCEYMTLSLQQWRSRMDQILADERAATTMVLFDRDFHREENGSEHEGIELVRQAQTTAIGFCGLISHTVLLQAEYQAWKQLSEEHGLERDKFIVISKERLTNDQRDFYGFLGMLRLVALNERYGTIRTSLWKIFKESIDKTRESMDQLSVLDFDRMIFESSRVEGVWEPETLFRVFGILMRKEARSRLYNDCAISSAVAEARRVSDMPREISVALSRESKSIEALRIQGYEIYDSSDEINQFHIPVELGDIYQSEGNGKHHILLVQSCDLMVRATGKRSYDNKLGRMGTLVEIVYGSHVPKPSRMELPYYDEEGERFAFVDFAKAKQVPLVILDLTVLHPDGQARIEVGSACPDLLIEPWKKRYTQLQKMFEQSLKRYGELSRQKMSKENKLLGLPMLSSEMRIPVSVDGQTVQYGLKRVRRLRQPWSGAFLTAFAQYQARAAFSHPIVRWAQA